MGAVLIAISVMLFMYNVAKTRRHGVLAGDDPWDARTLEWMTTSPPAEHNFDEIPVVSGRDELWHRKYITDEQGRLVRVPTGGADDSGHTRVAELEHGRHGDDGGADGHGHDGGHGIHMPSPSYYPALVSIAFPLIGFGAIYGWWFGALGALFLFAGVYGWASEPVTEESEA
jgi:cytochrome c oxidase subunit 1